MKRAEVLLRYMDKLKSFVELLGTFVEKGHAYLLQAQEWIRKLIELIDKGIDYLVNAIGGRPDNRQLDDHLFV
ncbi:MAG TPA: hypothetical protein VF581_00505 [Flavobacterium sp.]|jgi:hypothetical protein